MNNQYKDMAENKDKYAKELEENKQLENELKLCQSKIHDYEF